MITTLSLYGPKHASIFCSVGGREGVSAHHNDSSRCVELSLEICISKSVSFQQFLHSFCDDKSNLIPTRKNHIIHIKEHRQIHLLRKLVIGQSHCECVSSPVMVSVSSPRRCGRVESESSKMQSNSTVITFLYQSC